MSGSNPFKSVEFYKISKNSTGVTINGSGIINVLYRQSSSFDSYKTYIVLDNEYTLDNSSQSQMFFFDKSVKVYTATDGTIHFSIALFND